MVVEVVEEVVAEVGGEDSFKGIKGIKRIERSRI